MKNNIKKLVITSLCMALCIVLPLAFHSIPNGGSIFSPMHIPVLLCGIVCGPLYGLVCGIFGPLLSSLITQMPPLAYLPPMTAELAVYGLVCGICIKLVHTKKYILDVYISLAGSMLCGRVAAGLAKAFIFMPGEFSLKMWVTAYVIEAVPGIILHLLLIPMLVLVLVRARVIPPRYRESEFARYLKEQYRRHPSMQAQDVHKLCYQAAYGAEHLLCDLDAARECFNREYESVEKSNMPLYEEISPEVCRINLAAWKAQGLNGEWLFNMFAASVRVKRGTHEQFAAYMAEARRVLKKVNFDGYTVKSGPVHHSEEYRHAERAAYRIVDKSFIKFIPILQRITDKTRVIAFDGRAAAGKSTAAEALSKITGASVIHTDDFFLPPDMRSEERLSAPGGNVHYERFCSEVLPYIGSRDAFEYQVFDCGKMQLDGKREVAADSLCIVEGAYSLHKSFGDYADLKVFFDVEPNEQLRRIIQRNGAQMAEMFKTRWIPLEEAYIKAFRIKESADVVIK